MADISILSRLINGFQRNVDVSQNSLIVGSLKVGSSTPVEITKAIATKLIAVQAAADADGTFDTRYFTESELGSSTSSSGSDLIGDDNTYSNFTPTGATVKGALAGIDAAIANTADEKVGISATDTTPGYLAAKIQVDTGSNSTNALEESILNPAGDETLRIRFDQSKVDHGSIAGLGDDDHTIYIKADGTRAFSGDQSMGGNQLTNVGAPGASTDAANKAYVDAVAEGLKPKQAVRVGSIANINLANALENGDVIDGITLATGDRVLVKDQTAPEENGIYIVQATGAAVRATDFDSLSPIDEINGAYTYIQEGTQAGQGWVQQGAVAVIDTDPINFVYFNSASSVVGGDMITKTGNTLSVDLLTNGGLKSSNPGNDAGELQISLEASNPSLEVNGSNELKVKLDAAGTITSGASGLSVGVDDSTIEKNANALRVKDAGITPAKLAASVAGAGLSGGAGTALAVNVDDSTIEINSDTLRVKDAGISAAKLTTDVADQSTITGGNGSALAVQNAPKIQTAEIAGESISLSTLTIVRYALGAETAGRMYKADYDASSINNFYAIGAYFGAALSAADPMNIVKNGPMTVTGHGFTVGAPIFLTASGAVSSTAPSTADQAVVRIGMVKDANTIDISIAVVGIN